MKGKDLQAWRERMQWSQRQAAHALGVSRAAYQTYENDTVDMPTNVEESLAWLDLVATHPNLELSLPLAVTFRRYAARMNEANALPSPGRPRKAVPLTEALEHLFEVLLRNEGFLRRAAKGEPVTGAIPQRGFAEIVDAIAEVERVRE
jgi:DNA-binding XRE family transcriptional regulator